MPWYPPKSWDEGDEVTIEKLRNKNQYRWGAIGPGAPAGGSQRITYHHAFLLNILRRQGEINGVAAICGGSAQGDCL